MDGFIALDRAKTFAKSLVGNIYTKSQIDTKLSNKEAVITGQIILYGGSAAPSARWLVCNGSEVAKADYAGLYSVIGDTYGTPTTEGNFVLPDLSTQAAADEVVYCIRT